MERVDRIDSRTVVLPLRNVDTDQIIPARFLTGTTTTGLGARAFFDLRRDRAGRLLSDFPLNHESAAGATILVAGENFGCGSSREHAPWALREAGFRAVVCPSIADIFKANAIRNGLVPVEIDSGAYEELAAAPGARIVISVADGALTLPGGGSAAFHLPPFGRRCLLTGLTPFDFLLGHEPQIVAWERGRGDAPA